MDLNALRKNVGPDHRALFPCYRTDDVEAAYAEHKRRVLATYESLEDFILYTVFKCSGSQQANGRMRSLRCEAHPWAFTENPFPYDIAAELEHWILWSRSSREDLPRAARLIRDNFGDAVWFVNTSNNKSVPGLFHCHVFCEKMRL